MNSFLIDIMSTTNIMMIISIDGINNLCLIMFFPLNGTIDSSFNIYFIPGLTH